MASIKTVANHPATLPAAVMAIVVAFLGLWEGYEPVAKHEAIDPPGVITWCFGQTNYDDPTVEEGTRFTKAECEAMLPPLVEKYAAGVRACIPTFDTMPAKREASLISFAYNLGNGTLCKSSVARKLNAGDVQGGCDAMLLYNKADGVVIRGLQRRREAERKMCLAA